jgi:hypothetical protein
MSFFRRPATTRAHFGHYYWADQPEQRYAKWQDLPLRPDAPDAIAEQEDVPERLETSIALMSDKALGQGSSSIAFQCVVTTNHRRYDNEVVKFPLELVQSGYVRVDPVSKKTLQLDNNIPSELTKRLKYEMQREFSNYEKLVHGAKYQARFGVGERFRGVKNADLQELRNELSRIEADGLNYLHEYQHLDLSVPMIFTAFCDMTLRELRLKNRELFLCDGVELRPSKTWERCGYQVASAIAYMRSVGWCHTDIKGNNIFVRFFDPSRPEQLMCYLSDFEYLYLINDMSPKHIITTTRYAPDRWPDEQLVPCDPLIMTVHNFACLMGELLAFDNTAFPGFVECKPIGQRMALYVRRSPYNLVPWIMRRDYEVDHPVWCHIAKIFSKDFVRSPFNPHFEHVQDFLMSVSQHGGGGLPAKRMNMMMSSYVGDSYDEDNKDEPTRQRAKF